MAEAVPFGVDLRRLAGLPRGEARLATLARAGDERAFAAIFERYHQELYRYCRAIVGDSEDAQDALQNTMASALRALPGESREIALRPWLYRVARNEALSLIRRRREAGLEEDALPAVAPADADAETRERLRELVGDLRTLPEQQRSALVMRELSGLSHAEIAAALGVSPGAARQAVYEARSTLLELQEGRAMRCDAVREVISARDGRLLRGRKVRAHLRSCRGCVDFRTAIDTRRADFAALAPPLPAAAAASVLATVAGLEGGKLGGGLLAGLVGAAGGAGAGAKSISLLAATAAAGLGAAGLGGSLDLSSAGSGGGSAPPAAERPAAGAGQQAHRHAGASGDRGKAAPGRATAVASPVPAKAQTPARPGAPAASHSAAGGASQAARAGARPPAAPPGRDLAHERSSGQSSVPAQTAPLQAGPPPAAAPRAAQPQAPATGLDPPGGSSGHRP